MNRIKALIVDTFWKLLEEKSRSVQKDVLLKYLDIMGYRMICVYMENTETYVDMPKNQRDIFIRYYKCAFAGILLDWMENGASYDLVHFYDELCELFKKWDESTFFKPLTFKINE